MGRRKVEIRRIEDKSSRQVTFSKRRNGLMKKSRQLSVLCDVDVSLLVFSSRGRKYEFSSSSNSFAMVIERYKKYLEEEKAKTECSCSRTSTELMQMVQRSIEMSEADQLSVDELVQLEQGLGSALMLTRSRKTQLMIESISTLREKERLLVEETQGLQKEIATMVEQGNGVETGNADTRQQHGKITLDLLF